jgi:ferritin-like metal-binding protein YciE
MPHQAAFQDLFVDTLRDIYSAEKQILRALPKLARAAKADELREAFETHRDQTEDQVDRLERIFEMIGRRTAGPACEAMEAMLSAGEEIIAAYRDSDALDAGLIAAGQEVEHYEISRYRSLRALARDMGLDDAVTLLDETLKEEKETDRILTEIAESGVNELAQEASGEEAGASKPAAGSVRQSAKGTKASAGRFPRPAQPTPGSQAAGTAGRKRGTREGKGAGSSPS